MTAGMFRKTGVCKKRWDGQDWVTEGLRLREMGRNKVQHDVWCLTWATGWLEVPFSRTESSRGGKVWVERQSFKSSTC